MAELAYRVVPALGLLAAGTAFGAASVHADAVQRGGAIYRQNCAACHGSRGEGARQWQRPDAKGEMPAPPHDRQGHTWKHSDEMLYRIVREGWRDPFNKTPRITMPAFKGRLSRDETIAVIEYLKTLWTPQQRHFQAEESSGHPFPPEAR
jgi:mono/diheme cytochrome c family protein